MYMRNRKYDNYTLNSFPPNYAGQHSPEDTHEEPPIVEASQAPPHDNPEPPHTEEPNHKSILGSLFGGAKDGKGGLLGGLFNKDKDGGILSGIELEDLILLAVIFFLLKDGFEDDLIIIIALILLAG